jgi:hypothetical protein
LAAAARKAIRGIGANKLNPTSNESLKPTTSLRHVLDVDISWRAAFVATCACRSTTEIRELVMA